MENFIPISSESSNQQHFLVHIGICTCAWQLRMTGEERRPAERAVKLFPAKQFADAGGVKDMSTAAELTHDVIHFVIGEANEARFINGSLPPVL